MTNSDVSRILLGDKGLGRVGRNERRGMNYNGASYCVKSLCLNILTSQFFTSTARLLIDLKSERIKKVSFKI